MVSAKTGTNFRQTNAVGAAALCGPWVWDASQSSPRPLGTFRRWNVPRRRLCICFCQPERGIFQNPQFQPHILFSSRRKENVPLTVQEIGAAAPCVAQPPLAAALRAEQRAARGIAIPQDPQETGECSADSPVYQMTLPPEHCRVVMVSCTLDGIPGDGGTSAAFTNKTWSHTDRRCLP